MLEKNDPHSLLGNTVAATRSMVYKGHLYKGHSQNFQNGKGQSIVMHEKLRDCFIGDFKGHSSKNESCVQF